MSRETSHVPFIDAGHSSLQACDMSQEQMELLLSDIWKDVLNVREAGPLDSFFELGGDSVLAFSVLDRLRKEGVHVEARTLFSTPRLADLAQALCNRSEVPVPPNLISVGGREITPEMLPLISLTQQEIDHIVERTPGGIANIQDIYALSPLQEGIFFHHLLNEDGDRYLLTFQLAFAVREELDRYLSAVQQVVDRHDILRTAFMWEDLSTFTQVVRREAQLSVTVVELDPRNGPASEQLVRRFDPRWHRIDLSQPPLLRFAVAHDAEHDRWLLLGLAHNLVSDHASAGVLHSEVDAILDGQGGMLPPPQPFRNLIAQVRLGTPAEEHEQFFKAMLGDIQRPAAPYGVVDADCDGDQASEARQTLPQPLHRRLRAHARRLGVSLATLCHLAWGLVLARELDSEAVVFGTVLFGRMHGGEGAGTAAMGLFINVLPLRLDVGEIDVETAARRTHQALADLLRHEHASLAVAQRCSGVAMPTPLFTTMLNYRHNSLASPAGQENGRGSFGVSRLPGAAERISFPIILSVDDFGDALELTTQVVRSLEPERVLADMLGALERLAQALDRGPTILMRDLVAAPEAELRASDHR